LTREKYTCVPSPASLPFPTLDVRTADVPCPTCHGAGDAYYIPGRDVTGGKRVVCPTCGGERMVKVPAVATHHEET
jgi:DNA-directed RNA polymerase subunit RPC12/RpoP